MRDTDPAGRRGTERCTQLQGSLLLGPSPCPFREPLPAPAQPHYLLGRERRGTLNVSTSLTSSDGGGGLTSPLGRWENGGKRQGTPTSLRQAGRQGAPLLGELLPWLCAHWARGHGKKRVPRAVSLCGSSSAQAMWCVSGVESGEGLPWAAARAKVKDAGLLLGPRGSS